MTYRVPLFPECPPSSKPPKPVSAPPELSEAEIHHLIFVEGAALQRAFYERMERGRQRTNENGDLILYGASSSMEPIIPVPKRLHTGRLPGGCYCTSISYRVIGTTEPTNKPRSERLLSDANIEAAMAQGIRNYEAAVPVLFSGTRQFLHPGD